MGESGDENGRPSSHRSAAAKLRKRLFKCAGLRKEERNARGAPNEYEFCRQLRQSGSSGLTTFTNILMCVLGVLFMVGAFVIEGLGKRPPYHPITRTGRVLIFLIGLVNFLNG